MFPRQLQSFSDGIRRIFARSSTTTIPSRTLCMGCERFRPKRDVVATTFTVEGQWLCVCRYCQVPIQDL